MRTDIESIAQRVLDERGYLVISCLQPETIGAVVSGIDWTLSPLVSDRRDHKLLIISETNEADHIEQARIMGYTRWGNPRNAIYYRVIAE